MNEVFKEHLCKFVLVFFYDILIYSKTWDAHMLHLQVVFTLLHAHHLFLKKSKCSFGAKRVAYLGHIISGEGVSIDKGKIQAILD